MAVKRLQPRHLTEIVNEEFVELSPTKVLEQRLIAGERQIALAEARGEDTTHLVDFWIDLLHQYEAAFDTIPEAA